MGRHPYPTDSSESTINHCRRWGLKSLPPDESIETVDEITFPEAYTKETAGNEQLLNMKETIVETNLIPITKDSNAFGAIKETARIPYREEKNKKLTPY